MINDNEKNPTTKCSIRFNILDAIIILLVLLCILGIAFRYSIRDSLGLGEDLSDYVISFSLSAVDSALPDFLGVGSRIYFSDGSDAGVLLGVSDFSEYNKDTAGSETLIVSAASAYMGDYAGGVVLAEYPADTLVDAKGAFTCRGAYGEDGYFMLGGEKYLAQGQKITLYTDTVTLHMTINGIVPIQ